MLAYPVFAFSFTENTRRTVLARLEEDPETVAISPDFQSFTERMSAQGFRVNHTIEHSQPAGTPPEAARPTGVLTITRDA